ncbi:ribonuclease H-like domain-containing protein [Tanacetum coccineum]
MAKDTSNKKFLVSNYTNYKMVDSKRVLEQQNELLGILSGFTQRKMNMHEAIQVSGIIDKVPPSSKDFMHTLKHKKEDLILVKLGSHLRIVESLRVQESDKAKSNNVAGPLVVNMVEHNNSTRGVKVGNKANGLGTNGSVSGSNNPMKEAVYMHQPPGFTDSAHSDYVCLLQKSLYGLNFFYFAHATYHLFAPCGICYDRPWPIELFSRTSVETEKKLGPKGSPVTDPTLYHSLAGALHYFGLLHHSLLPTIMLTGQDTLSHSSAEAEYRGVANDVAETSWIRNLLHELHTPLFTATLVYCDNVSAVYMSANPVQHQHTKHIEIGIHFVHDKVAAGHVRVFHIPSQFHFEHSLFLEDPKNICMLLKTQKHSLEVLKDIIDVPARRKIFIDDEDALPHDLADSNVEDIINVDDDGVEKVYSSEEED